MEGGKIHDLIYNLNQLVCCLLILGEKIEQGKQSLLLLVSLPESFKLFRTKDVSKEIYFIVE